MQAHNIKQSKTICHQQKRKLNPGLVNVVKDQPGILLNMAKHALPTPKK
jgi:hypothetical protein